VSGGKWVSIPQRVPVTNTPLPPPRIPAHSIPNDMRPRHVDRAKIKAARKVAARNRRKR